MSNMIAKMRKDIERRQRPKVKRRRGGRSDVHGPVCMTADPKHGKPVGRLCLHCGLVMTLAGNPSEEAVVREGLTQAATGKAVRDSRSHKRRVKAVPMMGAREAKRIIKATSKARKRIARGASPEEALR